MPVYEYRCKTCDKRFETNDPVRGTEFVHFKEDGETATSDKCGDVVRVWSVNVNTANLRAARG